MKTKLIFILLAMALLTSCWDSVKGQDRIPTHTFTLTSTQKLTPSGTLEPKLANTQKITPTSSNILASPVLTPLARSTEMPTTNPRDECLSWSPQDKNQTYSIAFSPDGKLFASANWQGVDLFETSAGQLLTTTHPIQIVSCPVRSVAFSADGKMLAAGSCGKVDRNGFCQLGQIIIKDLSSRETKLVLKGHNGEVLDIAFNPKYDLIASISVGRGQEIILWDTGTGKLVHNLSNVSPYMSSITFNADGQALAYGYFDKVILFDIETNKEIVSLDYNLFGLWWSGDIAFSPNGKLLASGSCGEIDFEACIRGKINIWNVSTRQRLFSFEGHNNSVSAIAFSPDGCLLASGSDDQIQLWDIITGEHIRTFENYKGEVYDLKFSPNGEQIIIAGLAEPVILDIKSP